MLVVSWEEYRVNIVSSIVKRAAAAAGLYERFSSHRLRISRATAGIKAGLMLSQIMVTGGWLLKTVVIYLP
jgi:hypothetical protein